MYFWKDTGFSGKEILKATLEENLAMIADTVAFFVSKGKTVFYDAEHYFDGYCANPEYAIATLKAAHKAGAKTLVLCDTNGGKLPDEIMSMTAIALKETGAQIGIHCHNDTGMAVASSLLSVKGGAEHVQGTLLGFGERTGNANLSSIIANLQEDGYDCLPKAVWKT